jgi:hypothetical protein
LDFSSAAFFGVVVSGGERERESEENIEFMPNQQFSLLVRVYIPSPCCVDGSSMFIFYIAIIIVAQMGYDIVLVNQRGNKRAVQKRFGLSPLL